LGRNIAKYWHIFFPLLHLLVIGLPLSMYAMEQIVSGKTK